MVWEREAWGKEDEEEEGTESEWLVLGCRAGHPVNNNQIHNIPLNTHIPIPIPTHIPIPIHTPTYMYTNASAHMCTHPLLSPSNSAPNPHLILTLDLRIAYPTPPDLLYSGTNHTHHSPCSPLTFTQSEFQGRQTDQIHPIQIVVNHELESWMST